MAETNKALSGLIVLMVLIVVGAVFVTEIFNQTSALTNSNGNGIINETINMRNGTYTSFANKPIVTGSILVINGTSNTGINLGNFTIDYTNGRWFIKSQSTVGNNTNANVTYRYLPTEYINDSGSRSLIGLIGLFFVIGIAIFAIAYIKKEYLD